MLCSLCANSEYTKWKRYSAIAYRWRVMEIIPPPFIYHLISLILEKGGGQISDSAIASRRSGNSAIAQSDFALRKSMHPALQRKSTLLERTNYRAPWTIFNLSLVWTFHRRTFKVLTQLFSSFYLFVFLARK